jgi:hypothetical protein
MFSLIKKLHAISDHMNDIEMNKKLSEYKKIEHIDYFLHSKK